VLGKKTSISALHFAATFPGTTCNSRWTRWTTISGRPAMEHCMLWTSSDKRQDAKELDLCKHCMGISFEENRGWLLVVFSK